MKRLLQRCRSKRSILVLLVLLCWLIGTALLHRHVVQGPIMIYNNNNVDEVLVPIDDLQRPTSSNNNQRRRPVVVDIMSFGSISRTHLLETQKTTWASHPIVRHFFNVTELNDANPNCIYGKRDIYKITRRCRSKRTQGLWPRYQMMPAKLTLGKAKTNPMGWHCGHARPGTGIGVLGRWYRRHSQSSLPDFILFVDDDNLYNPYFLQQRLQTEDPSIPKVWAGCLKIDFPTPPHRFWLYGGGGSIWSRASMERAIQPIHCNSSSSAPEDDEFEKHVCHQLNHSNSLLLQEQKYWRDGMSVSDLMYEFANRNGCIYSDYMQSFFVNYYHLSSQVWNGSLLGEVEESRLHPYEPSYAYGFTTTTSNNNQSRSTTGRACHDAPTGKCSKDSVICHGLHDSDTMRSLWIQYQDSWKEQQQ